MSSPIAFPELYKAGFDDFIIPSHETAPFTTIQNRAKVTRSLKAIAGVERVHVKGVNRLQNEFGPNGEQVWEADNKDSRIRFVGSWTLNASTSGSLAFANTVGDFFEVTFYGTGLNLVHRGDSPAIGYNVSIDGGANSAVTLPVYSSVLIARGYAPNAIYNLSSGLTLGWHTIRVSLTAQAHLVQGFEILNQRTDLAVYQGSGIAQGALNGLSSLATSSFTDGVVGTRGARVVKYIDNGTLKSAVQAVDASAAYLASANHTNEEVVRRINFREFGANRADDFSTLAGVVSDRAFTLDDGTTTLVGNDVNIVSTSGLDGVIVNTNSGGFATLTFVGTGLDLFLVNNTTSAINNTANAFEFYVDGVLVGNLPVQASDTHLKIFKVCSGLPYGTHTVRVFRNAPNNWSIGLHDFIIYQPKKPSIPAGALEVADYNVMASFSFGSSIVEDTPSAGIIRKNHTREFTFVGTWAIAQSILSPTGWATTTSTAASYTEYSFFGTGFVLRFGNNAGAQSQTISVNGSTNLSSFTTVLSATAGLSFTAATGVITGSPAGSIANNQLQVSGLALGYHRVRVAWTSGLVISPYAFDIITPIHINQPSLKTGSLSLKSATKYSPEKVVSNAGPDLSKAKAWVFYDQVNSRILASYNISAVLNTTAFSSIFYFEKPFKNANYIATGLTNQAQIDEDTRMINSLQITCSNSSGVGAAGLINACFFGELIDE